MFHDYFYQPNPLLLDSSLKLWMYFVLDTNCWNTKKKKKSVKVIWTFLSSYIQAVNHKKKKKNPNTQKEVRDYFIK